MLGLPSTTEVGRKLPKEAFYRNVKMSTDVKDSFVHDIESIMFENSVQATTSNFADGEKVHEVQVIRVDLKSETIPRKAIEAIDGANSEKSIIACTYEGKGCLAVKMSKLVVGPWRALDDLTLKIAADSLDSLWDSLASQIAYDDMGKDGIAVEERFVKDQKAKSMREEIARLEVRARKEKQFNKKNELFAKAKKLKAELADFEKGM